MSDFSPSILRVFVCLFICLFSNSDSNSKLKLKNKIKKFKLKFKIQFQFQIQNSNSNYKQQLCLFVFKFKIQIQIQNSNSKQQLCLFVCLLCVFSVCSPPENSYIPSSSELNRTELNWTRLLLLFFASFLFFSCFSVSSLIKLLLFIFVSCAWFSYISLRYTHLSRCRWSCSGKEAHDLQQNKYIKETNKKRPRHQNHHISCEMHWYLWQNSQFSYIRIRVFLSQWY